MTKKRKPVAQLYRAHSWSTDSGPENAKQPWKFYMAEDIDPLFDQQAGTIQMLSADHSRMRMAGCALASAAMAVVGEYDGLHRLALAVAAWAQAIADEGGRPHDRS